MRSRFSFWYYFTSIILPEFVYTMVITIFLYFILLKINQKLEEHEKRRAIKFELWYQRFSEEIFQFAPFCACCGIYRIFRNYPCKNLYPSGRQRKVLSGKLFFKDSDEAADQCGTWKYIWQKRKASGLQWTCIFHFHQWQYNLFKHKRKNKAVNAELAEILTVLKNNGETLNNDFKIDRKKTVHTALMYPVPRWTVFAQMFSEKVLPMISNTTKIPESMRQMQPQNRLWNIWWEKITLASVRNTMGIWHTVSLLFVMPCLETALQDTRK